MPETFHTSSQYYNLPTPVHIYVRFSFPLSYTAFKYTKIKDVALTYIPLAHMQSPTIYIVVSL